MGPLAFIGKGLVLEGFSAQKNRGQTFTISQVVIIFSKRPFQIMVDLHSQGLLILICMVALSRYAKYAKLWGESKAKSNLTPFWYGGINGHIDISLIFQFPIYLEPGGLVT